MQLKIYNGKAEDEKLEDGVEVIITNETPTLEQAAAYRRFWELVLSRVLSQKAA